MTGSNGRDSQTLKMQFGSGCSDQGFYIHILLSGYSMSNMRVPSNEQGPFRLEEVCCLFGSNGRHSQTLELQFGRLLKLLPRHILLNGYWLGIDWMKMISTVLQDFK